MKKLIFPFLFISALAFGAIETGNLTVKGIITGDGSGLTNMNASNLASGTVGAARLPNPSSTTLGGVQSAAPTSNQWINSISTSGVPALSQPAFTNISGTASIAQGGTGQVTKAAAFDALSPCTTGGGGLITFGSSTNSCLTTSIGDVGKPLVSAGGSGPDAWATLGVVGGGTGLATLTAHAIQVGNGTTAVTQLALGSSGQILQSAGGSADPAFSTPTYPSASGTAGKVLRSDGTNNVYSSFTIPDSGTSGGIPYYSSTSAISSSAALGAHLIVLGGGAGATPATIAATGSSGQVLTSNGSSSDPTFQDVGAATASSYYNFLRNGEFRFWQLTTPATLTTVTDGGYILDQWYMIDSNGGSTSQAARADASGTAVGGQYTPYWGQFRQSNATAKQIGVCQPLDNKETIKLRGQSATFAFYAKGSGSYNIRTCIGEWTGTADSITRDVVSVWGATPTWIGSFACDNTPADVGVTTSWAQVSTTASITTSANNLILCTWMAATQAQNTDLFLSQAQLVIGSSALNWKLVQKNYFEDLEDVKKFYRKSYAVDTITGTATTAGMLFSGSTASASHGWVTLTYPEMFKVPTLSAFWDSAGNASKCDCKLSSSNALTTNLACHNSDILGTTSWQMNFITTPLGGVGMCGLHYALDARL